MSVVEDMTNKLTTKSERKVSVTEKRLQSIASEVFGNGSLVTTEVMFIQNKLGATARPSEMEEMVRVARSTPHNELMSVL